MSRLLPLVLLLAPAPHAQEAPPAPATPTLARPATVNGDAITAADVYAQSRLQAARLARAEPAAREHLARRGVAEEMLLAQEARRLGVELADRDVDAWWERRTGEPPDWTALAAATGSSPERQREFARRASLAESYLLHRCGLRGDQAQRVAPDPLLVRATTVTPGQLREAFVENRALFDRPEALLLEIWVREDESGRDAVLAALQAGRAPEGAPPIRRSVPVDDLAQVFPGPVADWLAAAETGSALAPDGRSVLVLRGREAARAASFTEVQEPLRNLLLEDLLAKARQHLVDQLRDQATYWPPELFEAAPRPEAGAVANPAGPP